MKQVFTYFRLALRLIVGNALIISVSIVVFLVYFRIMGNGWPVLNNVFFLLFITATPTSMFMYWIRSGRVYRRLVMTTSRLAVNLLMAEIWPVFIGLYLRQPYYSDDGTPLIFASVLNTLFAIGMPLIVVLSYLLSKNDNRSLRSHIIAETDARR